jgi:hypothetical protein
MRGEAHLLLSSPSLLPSFSLLLLLSSTSLLSKFDKREE